MVRGGRKADGFYATDTQNRVATPIRPMCQDNIFSTAQLALVAEQADAADSKSATFTGVGVRPSPRAYSKITG